MKEYLKQILESKILEKAGMIIVALVSLFVLYKTISNDLPHIEQAVNNNTSVIQKLDGNMQLNTEVLRGLERRMR